jgi:DNA-binding winged helix-turn-helix (wHTH) protein/TolB-like protein/tetratricopeptide (TPR) repeat protein
VTSVPTRTQLRFDQYTLDPIAGRLRRGERTIELRSKSFEVLTVLAQHAGQLVTKEELFTACWPNVVVTDDSLVQCVRDIRRAIDNGEQQTIRTVPGRGYVFTRSVTELGAAPAPAVEESPPPGSSTPEPKVAGRPAVQRARLRDPRRRRWTLIAAAMLIMVGASAWFGVPHFGREPYIDNPLFTLVVLPLANVDGTAAAEQTAEKLTTDLTVELSRISSSFVIAHGTAARYRGKTVDPRQVGRELGVRYALQGRIAGSSNRAQLNLELIDTVTGQEIWAERFDGDETGFLLPKIVRTLQLKLLDTEAFRASRERPTAPTVDDLAIRGHALIERQTVETIAQARELALQAVEREPSVVYGWNTLAATYYIDLAQRWYRRYGTREEWKRRLEQAAAKAYNLDPNNFYALGQWSFSLQTQGRFEEAIAANERQIAMNRNYAIAFHRVAYLKMLMGLPEESLALEQQVLRTTATPKDHLTASVYNIIAVCLIHLGRAAEAVAAAQKAIEARPDFPNGHADMAAAAGNTGDLDRAHIALAEFRRLIPNFTLRSFRDEQLSTRPTYVEQHQRYYEGLRKAGLEE